MEDRFRVRVWDTERKTYIYDAQFEPDYDVIKNDEKYIPEQCTGLKDKNGKLIYEGDIVNVTQFYNGVPTTKKKAIKVLYKFGRFNVHDVSSCYLEIIGNIHENSELLEGNNG